MEVLNWSCGENSPVWIGIEMMLDVLDEARWGLDFVTSDQTGGEADGCHNFYTSSPRHSPSFFFEN